MKETKIERILIHLLEHKSIDQVTAGQKYDCWRLSSVIHTLRKLDLDIETVRKNNDPCIYRLRRLGVIKKLIKQYRIQRLQHHLAQKRLNK